MYRNSLRPSTRFGIALSVLAAAGTLLWLGLFLDEDMEAFDAPGLVILVCNGVFFALSLLFFGRVGWVRLAASVMLHLVGIGALVLAVAGMWMDDTIGIKAAAAGVMVLAAGLSFVGILSLHSSDMRCDLACVLDAPRAAVRRRRIRRVAVVLAGLVVLGLSWTAWQVVPLLLAEPTISIDYLVQANELSRPADYDPNLNAAPHYETLFANFVPLSDQLEEQWRAWPDDLTPEQLVAFDEWALSQGSSLQSLAAAARCPYWWYEMTSEDGALCSVKVSYAQEMRRCVWAVVLLAKRRASQGQVDAAIGLLADMHMAGVHRARGTTLVEQMSGVAVCGLCYDALLAILDRCAVDAATLRRTLEVFEARLPPLCVPRFEEIERLYGYDSMQRTFSDDGRGSGRLIPHRLYEMKKDGSLYSPPLSYLEAIWICTIHPDRAETLRLFDERWAMCITLTDQGPWQLYSRGVSCETRLDELLAGNYLLRSGARATAGCIQIGWRSRVHGRAVVATLAILTWKAEKGQWPNSLADLVAEGYLQDMPMDPYSDEPLIYKVTGDNFTLYSVAENFLDDRGESADWNLSEWGGDRVFWPVDRAGETATDDNP
jgi:hypothetical protein